MAMSRSFGGRLLTALPSIRTVPPEISSRPAIMRSVVDLPHPLGPTSTMNSRSLISRSIFWTTATLAPDLSWYVLVSFSMRMVDMGWVSRIGRRRGAECFWVGVEPLRGQKLKLHPLPSHGICRGSRSLPKYHCLPALPRAVRVPVYRLGQNLGDYSSLDACCLDEK